jgi:hypothetical protein
MLHMSENTAVHERYRPDKMTKCLVQARSKPTGMLA